MLRSVVAEVQCLAVVKALRLAAWVAVAGLALVGLAFLLRVEMDASLARRMEEQAVLRVLRSGWLTTGNEAAAFEAEFAKAVGASQAVARVRAASTCYGAW